MKNKIDYNFLVFILIWFLIPLPSLLAQENTGMLMFQIEGKQFEKNNYDKNGFITDSQVLNVGKIKKDTKGYSLKINTKIFNEKGTLKSEKSFNYLCDKSQNGAVFMGVFPFVNTKSGNINIEVLSNNFLYPNSLENEDKVNDFSLLVNYKTGFLGVNTKTFLNITNRKITKLINGRYELNGNIEIKTFVGKLNVLTLNYISNEIIEIANGIIFQKYTEKDGSYFTIELKN
tara:strand:- start:2695 stop:3387 length:693 start_codon:yes stop_codon:yes gene_type:complete